jgi:hypothetical protein
VRRPPQREGRHGMSEELARYAHADGFCICAGCGLFKAIVVISHLDLKMARSKQGGRPTLLHCDAKRMLAT